MVDVFVDTSAWYALRVANDQNHQKARSILGRLLEEKAWLHTCDWVLVETISLIARRIKPQDAVGAGHWILRSGAVRLHPMSDCIEAAWTLFQERKGRVSLVDCGSFALMDKLGLTRAFAFDEDFEERGFQTEN